jgi:hypothetical protein
VVCVCAGWQRAPAENGTAARPALGPQMSPSDGMGFDMDTLKTLTLGNGDISGPALAAFCNKTHELIFAVWSSDRSNPAERQELKQEFVTLMREHVWVPTIACAIYVVIVFLGPSIVRSPWPVRENTQHRQPPQKPRTSQPPASHWQLHDCCLTGYRGAQVKPVLVAWNLLLSVFSAVGAYHCMGGLLANVRRMRCLHALLARAGSLHAYTPRLSPHPAVNQMAASGWRYTVCTEPKTIDLVGTDLDVWACFFVLSKIFEFFDTILKILLKKDFIFLHWYHHLATAWLCWLSLAYNFAPVCYPPTDRSPPSRCTHGCWLTGASPGSCGVPAPGSDDNACVAALLQGTWIAALNYSVHAPMYFYYFLSSVLNKKWFTIICKPVAPLITTMQTSQMAVRALSDT